MSSKNKNNKRLCTSYSSSDSEDDSVFPSFLVIKSQTEKSIGDLSPFVVEKVVLGVCGTPKNVKTLKSGDLLVEVSKRQQAINLLNLKKCFDLPVTVTAHNSLNSSKGVIRCPSLKNDTDEEILTYLKSQKVSHVRRIKVKRDGNLCNTNTFVITFNQPNLPSTIKVGFQVVRVDVYIPNPLRCFNCQKFGHHESNCRQKKRCAFCGEIGHAEDEDSSCVAKFPSCCNCSGKHPTHSRECPTWHQEKNILKVKYTQNLSFPEARRLVENASSSSTTSYAGVLKRTTCDASTQTCDASTQTTPITSSSSSTTTAKTSSPTTLFSFLFRK